MSKEFAEIKQALDEGHIACLERTVNGKTYARRFSLPERLILLGAGHVSQATAVVASFLGFDVTVVDDRAEFANRERFPTAKEIICDDFVDAISDRLNISTSDYICILTRGHRWDMDCFRAVISQAMPRYLGMIGSERRISAMLEILEAEGYSQSLLAQLHAPIGLGIGACTPAEIAVSIAAELVCERRAGKAKGNWLEQTDVDWEMLRFLLPSDVSKAFIMVLETEGSTPAGTGAMMAVDGSGCTFGTVGGGCGEALAVAKAKNLIGTGRSETITLDMTNEIAGDRGMVCGGKMLLLIEDVVQEKP